MQALYLWPIWSYKAVFYEYKERIQKDGFSTKKTAWVVMVVVYIFNVASLIFPISLDLGFIALDLNPEHHWIVVFSEKGVSDLVINTILGLFTFALAWAAKIYKDGKAQGAA